MCSFCNALSSLLLLPLALTTSCAVYIDFIILGLISFATFVYAIIRRPEGDDSTTGDGGVSARPRVQPPVPTSPQHRPSPDRTPTAPEPTPQRRPEVMA
jgi:hypothetical protein